MIVTDNQQRLLMPQLRADEINHILHAFKLTLTATTDMLDTPAPCISGWHFIIVNDKPEQK